MSQPFSLIRSRPQALTSSPSSSPTVDSPLQPAAANSATPIAAHPSQAPLSIAIARTSLPRRKGHERRVYTGFRSRMAAEADNSTAKGTAPGSAQGPDILVVDDTPANLQLLSSMLK